MRNALVIKVFALFLLFVSLNTDLYGQYKKRKLFVPYRSQQTGKWCWSASMKMIMDFHNPGDSTRFSQCDLVKRLVKFTTPGIDTSTLACCIDCSGGCATGSPACTSPLTSRSIICTSEGMPTRAEADNYDLIFSSYSYSSIQKINWKAQPMSWLEVRQQIDDCRPFIINIEASPAATNELSGNHAVVVTGYEQVSPTNTTLNGIFVNDPWKPCCGKNEAFFPYSVFTRLSATDTAEGGTYFVNRVLSTVQSIRPDTLFTAHDNCESCSFLEAVIYPETDIVSEDTVLSLSSTNPSRASSFATPVHFTSQNLGNPPDEPKGLPELLEQNGRNIIGYKKGVEGNKPFTLDTAMYERILRSEPGYYDAPVQYISSQRVNRSYFLACLFPPRRLSKVVLSGYDVVDVVSGRVDKNLVSTLQKNQSGAWELRKIATYTSIDSTMQIRVNNSDRSVRITNARNTPNSAAIPKYTLVKYFPEQYEFFSFKIHPNDRTTYLAPAENYPELELTKHVAYKEQQVIRTLRSETQQLDRLIRRLLANQQTDEINRLPRTNR